MISILHQDKNIVVCIKPVGLDSEHDLPAALGGEIYAVHRLDKNVGGLMVYARNKATAAELSRQIQAGEFVKEYVALVEGCPPELGDWEDLLFKDSRKNKVFVVKRQRTGVKLARLSYWTIDAGEQTLVRVRLHTGRSHQIRVQMNAMGHPVYGDMRYGGEKAKKGYLALWAYYLSFTHPVSKERMVFRVQPPHELSPWDKFDTEKSVTVIKPVW